MNAIRWAVVSGISICVLAAGIVATIHRARPHSGGEVAHRGELGGKRVSLPARHVHLLEFDADQQRDRRIASFGFTFQFPLSQPSLDGTHTGSSSGPRLELVDVTVLSGTRYGVKGDDALEFWVNFLEQHLALEYRKLVADGDQFGLNKYRTELMPDAPSAARLITSRTYYIHREEGGRVDVFIECSDSDAPKAGCKENFFPGNGMKAHLYASYPKYLLRDWVAIRSATRSIVASFEER